MTPHQNAGPAARLAAVLRAENDALALGDAEAATRLLPEKQAAAAALQAALPTAPWTRDQATELQSLADENRRRLSQAIAVQSTILEMVARAARGVVSGPVRYGAGGTHSVANAALAFSIRA